MLVLLLLDGRRRVRDVRRREVVGFRDRSHWRRLAGSTNGVAVAVAVAIAIAAAAVAARVTVELFARHSRRRLVRRRRRSEKPSVLQTFVGGEAIPAYNTHSNLIICIEQFSVSLVMNLMINFDRSKSGTFISCRRASKPMLVNG